MKKFIAIVALVVLASCGESTTTKTTTTDSTVVKADTTVCTDSTKCDSVKIVK
jgi:major membrane immunogen (membrane-anchored lipoprotein)